MLQVRRGSPPVWVASPGLISAAQRLLTFLMNPACDCAREYVQYASIQPGRERLQGTTRAPTMLIPQQHHAPTSEGEHSEVWSRAYARHSIDADEFRRRALPALFASMRTIMYAFRMSLETESSLVESVTGWLLLICLSR